MKVKLSQNCDRCYKSKEIMGNYVCTGCNDDTGCIERIRERLNRKEVEDGTTTD